MSASSNRMPLIDAFKAIASQLIVLHHLAAYGPLSEAMQWLALPLNEFLFEYGRMAVQVFLVIAGFLAARGLSGSGEALGRSPLPLIWSRYVRLVVPYLAAIGIAIVAAALANIWMDDESIPARASLAQWLAHVFLLQSVLGFDSLSAGVWYVAIDFQLFALMALLLWFGRVRFVAPLLVLAMGGLSLFWFNRNAALDNWAIYFFGSYALGAAAWWASDRRHLSLWLGAIATIGTAALVLDFRMRIAIALVTALMLAFSRRRGILETWPDAKPLAFLGRISYSVFLVHFPVCLLINTVYAQLHVPQPATAVLAMVAAWVLSIGAGTIFYRWIESPAASRRITSAITLLSGRMLAPMRRLPVVSALLARWGWA